MRPFRDAAWFYAEYRYRSDEFLRPLVTHLDWTRRTRVLDLGAGPAHVSVRLAPFVGEVVVMDPEEEMLAEGRRRATGVENLTFVLGGSDDLPVLELGAFDGVLISQALHWMPDKDAVLRALDARTVATGPAPRSTIPFPRSSRARRFHVWSCSRTSATSSSSRRSTLHSGSTTRSPAYSNGSAAIVPRSRRTCGQRSPTPTHRR